MTLAGASPQLEKLDVGCGLSALPGFLGVDRNAAADVIHDLDLFPWPFQSDSFSHVVCRHSLGHLSDLVRVMEELHRVCRNGALIEIVSPHFSSDNFFTDITHKHSFGYRSFDYFCINRPCRYRYSHTAKFLLIESHISFVQARSFEPGRRKLNPARWLGIEFLINCLPRLYEHFLAFILRANEIYFRLQVVKE